MMTDFLDWYFGMHAIIRYFTTFIFFNILFCPFLSADEGKYSNLIVEKLDIVIANQPPESSRHLIQTIGARLKTKQGGLFSQTDFDSDLKLLIQDYDRVEPHVDIHEGKVLIQLKIWQNPRIRRIIWEGVEKVKLSSLKKELNIQEGSLYNTISFNKQFNKIKAYYVKDGFFETQASYEITYDDITNEIDIVIKVCEGRAGKIQNIVFCNFTNEERCDISEMMATKKYNFFMSWLTNEGIYNEEAIQHDRFIILNYFHNKGFADAKIDFNVEETCDCNKIILTISVDRGECYTIGEISLEGNCIFSREDLLNLMEICPGDPFSPEELHNTCGYLMDYYGKFGYIESTVIFEPSLIPGERVFNIKILVNEGEEYCVGLIKVLGNCTTQTNVILHETLLVPGEVFNIEKLKKTEARLLNIGYFSNVNVYAVKTADDCVLSGNYRDIHIEVEETNTGNLGAFFGFSTTENMFGGINITERNFNYKGFRRLFQDGYQALRGGGEYAHITLSLGTKSRTYGLSWTKPYFMDTPWSVGFDLERSNTGYISDDVDIKSTSLTFHATYLCNAFMKVGPHLRFRYSDIDVSDDASVKMKSEADNAGLIVAVGMSWLYNSTNHPLCPTKGIRSAIEAEVAGFGGEQCFFSVAYLNSYFYNLWDFGVLKLRGDFRFIQPMRGSSAIDLPMDERFFLGGDYNVRGYRPYRLGPKFDNDPDEPEGGVSMQLFSAEISRPVFSRVDAFVFADAGAISINTWQFGGYYYSVGYGARLKIFDGAPPLTIGMGYPLNAKDSSDVKKFFLQVGGKF